MSNTLTSIALVFCGAILHACDSQESTVKDHLRTTIEQESKGSVKLESFQKTNGYEETFLGQKFYVVEWTAEVSTTKRLWKGSINKFNPFYWSNFATTTTNPELTQGTFRMPYQYLDEGATVRLTGRTGLQNTENGWRPTRPEVLTSKVTSGLLGTQ